MVPTRVEKKEKDSNAETADFVYDVYVPFCED